MLLPKPLFLLLLPVPGYGLGYGSRADAPDLQAPAGCRVRQDAAPRPARTQRPGPPGRAQGVQGACRVQ